MITSQAADTWQDIQSEIASILRECGFEVALEKTSTTARGEVEIDVYAEEIVKGRKYTILCECKHGKNRIPQSVIHAFRTTVADIGANIGYVISSSGFQAGAFAASELTNLQLATWQQFQTVFKESWLEGHFFKHVAYELDALLTYTEPLLPKWLGDLDDERQIAFMNLKAKHDALGHLVLLLTPYSRMFSKELVPALPLREALRHNEEFLQCLPSDLLDATGYKQLRDLLLAHGRVATDEFRAIRDRR